MNLAGRSGDLKRSYLFRTVSGIDGTVVGPTGVCPLSRGEPPVYNVFEFERRKERVRSLLESHDEIYDSVSRNETATSGFAEPVRRTFPCPCDGAGCGQCERSAVRAADLGIDLPRGRVLVLERDRYDTGLEGAFDPAARSKRDRAKLMDDTIERLQEMELVRQGVYAERVDNERLLELAEARDARGSYRELRAALDVMPGRLRGDAAVAWLAEFLPRPIRIPRWAYEQEVDRVSAQIVGLSGQGLTVDEIRSELGVSRRQVKRALRESQK